MNIKLFTLAQAAEQIGCHKSQTGRKAEELGLGTWIGRQRLLTAGEIAKLRRAIKPRPRKPG